MLNLNFIWFFVIFCDEVLVDIVTLAIYSNYPWLLLYMDVSVRGWGGQGWLGGHLKGGPLAPFDVSK